MTDIPNDFMKGFNKPLILQKLREIGMNDVAQKLNSLSENEIERMIRTNPSILKKASDMMKGGIK